MANVQEVCANNQNYVNLEDLLPSELVPEPSCSLALAYDSMSDLVIISK